MKKLKYIALFEAFESIKLKKTLQFINLESKKNFLRYIKTICKKFSFPLSKISDDLFEYLPLKKAIDYHIELKEIACTATSKSEFTSFVPDEKCTDGKLKRLWGSSIRKVTCPRCNGTGMEPITPTWNSVKFWFSQDNKLVATTATNGTIFGEGQFKHDYPVTLEYNGISKKGYYWSNSSIEQLLKSANFALILDLDKLKLKLDTTESQDTIKDKREQNKDNSIALLSSEDIKDKNIERYLNIIIQKSMIKGDLEDIKNFTKLVNRMLGGDKILFTLHPNSNVEAMSTLNRIGDAIYDIMFSLQKDNSQENKNSLINKINNINLSIESHLKSLREDKYLITKSLNLTKSFLNSSAELDKNYVSVKLFNNIMEINNLIYKYVSNYKINTLHDYESLLADLTTITELLNKSRYLSDIRNFFSKTSSRWGWDDAKAYLTNIILYTTEIESALDGTERFIKFLKTKYSL